MLTPSEEGGEEVLDADARRQRRRKAPPLGLGFCCRQAHRLSVVPGCTPLGLFLRRRCCNCNMKFLVCCNIWSAFGALILFFFGAAAFPTDECVALRVVIATCACAVMRCAGALMLVCAF